MKKISKLFSSFVLMLVFSHTAFGHDKEWEFNSWSVNRNGLVLNIVAMYPGSTGSTGSTGIAGGISLSRPIDRVGIGTKTPSAALHVHGEESNAALSGSLTTLKISSGNQFMLFDGNEIDAAVDGLYLNHNSNGKVILATGGGNVGIGMENPGKKLDINGTTRTKVIEITGGSDLSEKFDIGKPRNIKDYVKENGFKIEPGMVACIDPENPGKLLISCKAYDRTVAGIISGAGGVQPGMLMGQKGSEADGEFSVALTGRVYCKADATLGKIQPGDLLTTSDTPGYVMKVSDYDKAQGAIIGKAMSSLKREQGLVLVLVTLQ